MHCIILFLLFVISVVNGFAVNLFQELARLNTELANEREKLETLASELSDEYEHIKQ